MLIDTHCHLTDQKIDDVEGVVERARSAGVEKIIVPTTSIEDIAKGRGIAEKYSLYYLAGIHPEEVSDLSRFHELETLVDNTPRLVGIGEIGLDFFWDKEKSTKEDQLSLFKKQMALAEEKGLPVVIHMRQAEEEMIEALSSIKKMPKGQFHCFAGSRNFLEFVLGLGFYVSFCGNITHKNAHILRELIKMVPSNRLLLETDTPYLAPEPMRGSINEPANVKIIAKFIAQETGVDFEDLAKNTTNNALCLYSLES